MTLNVPLSLVKLKLACADVLEYDGQRAGDIARHGVFVPSRRPRAPGERVRLEIELLDGTCAYDGPAVVVEPEPGARKGYRVLLESPADGGAPAPPPMPLRKPTPPPTAAARAPTPPPLPAARAPAPLPLPAHTPTPPPLPLQTLSESLFDALGPVTLPARTPPPGPPPLPARSPAVVLGRPPAPASPSDDAPDLVHLPPPEPE